MLAPACPLPPLRGPLLGGGDVCGQPCRGGVSLPVTDSRQSDPRNATEPTRSSMPALSPPAGVTRPELERLLEEHRPRLLAVLSGWLSPALRRRVPPEDLLQ